MFTHATPFNPVDDNRTHPFHREHGSFFWGSRGRVVSFSVRAACSQREVNQRVECWSDGLPSDVVLVFCFMYSVV